MRTVLIIGGYGVFGGRIARLLTQQPGIEILVAGRSEEKADTFCRSLGKPNARPIQIDRNSGIEDTLAALAPWLVIDATGPFQADAENAYRVAIASLRAGAHYIDIADAREFVVGIETLDAMARECGKVAISGASSVPALTSAIVEYLGADLLDVTDIDIALSASNRATVGANVIRAILSYVGKPIPTWQQAREGVGYGWQSLQLRDFHVPGRPLIKRRLVGLCDVPDIQLLPRRHRHCRNAAFRAGAELWYQNLSLWLLSWMVRWGWINNLEPISSRISVAQRWMRFLGSDRSAMETRILGRDHAGIVERRHTILAEAGDGPWIPCLAAALLARKLTHDGSSLPAGAYPAVAILPLRDFEQAFAAFNIHCGKAEWRLDQPLYAQVLQSAWGRLPAQIRNMHDSSIVLSATGTASVQRGKNPIACLVNRAFGFPAEGEDVPVKVDFAPGPRGEVWQRRFGNDTFVSRLSAGSRAGQIIEQFGPVRFGFQLVATEARLAMLFSDWRLWILPLPRFLAPRIEATETAEDGVFTFDVRIDLPLGVRLIHYRGTLVPSH